MKRGKPLQVRRPPSLTVKLRRCSVKLGGCGANFAPQRDRQIACSVECAASIGPAVAAKEAEKKAKKERAEHRAKLADSKGIKHWLGVTERVVNHYILTRDAAYGCISCGTRTTVQWEAGHYLSVGAHRELRFDPMNIHKQCHRCNVQFSGNQAAYRIGLVERHGSIVVDDLEGPHPVLHWTREELEVVRKHFSAETRRLKKADK